MTGVVPLTSGGRPAAALASAWSALCGLPATGTWVWLVRSGALEAAAAAGVVLLDALPGVLGGIGAEVLGHG
jgi:hypothetical protein